MEYNLTFIEAITACLNDKGFIRGNDFASGMYVKKDGQGTLIIVDASGNWHHKTMDLYVSNNLMNQKWALFKVANKKNLKRPHN